MLEVAGFDGSIGSLSGPSRLALASGTGDPRVELASLDEAIRRIPTVGIPTDLRLEDERKRLLASLGTLGLQQANRRIERAANSRKPRLPELDRLSRNMRAELLPHVAAALTGTVYAYYLRPEDLPVAEDPLFLPKHEFFDLDLPFLDKFIGVTQLKGIGEDTGAFIQGGFAGIATAAGRIAQFGVRVLDPDAVALAQIELASMRSTRWRGLREADLRRFSLTVLLGREWIVEAASEESLWSGLLGAGAGVLSASRTRGMLSSLDERNWPAVRGSFSLSDLDRLGRARLSASSDGLPESPVARAIAALPADAGSRDGLDLMGSIRSKTFGYSRPRMWEDAPYEEYERYLSDLMIAERTAELKLYLVQAADSLGVPVETLARVAEPMAKRVRSEVQMGDMWDWRSALRTFADRTRPAPGHLARIRARRRFEPGTRAGSECRRPILPDASEDAIFTAVARLVKVHVNVADGKRRYVRGLTRDRFRVLDNGERQEISVFEADESGFSCAILLDRTGSMKRALPTVKRAILEFIDDLRSNHSVAVYAFSTQLEQLQPFTLDKNEAKRAVLKTRADGATALFDSVYRVTKDLAEVEGKKALLVFTDGDDNSSVLNARSEIRQARAVGAPVFAAAQGQALENRDLVKQIRELSRSTGGRQEERPGAADLLRDFQSAEAWLSAGISPASGDERRMAGHRGGCVRSQETADPREERLLRRSVGQCSRSPG